ncbi:shieldin complex subunit 2 [Embiotoca jacksoni]|uniref:shieldin complex subunit 2 n=1 Tax=Embiotoca jacksoni TaxID=100190 RepID=UPI003704B574
MSERPKIHVFLGAPPPSSGPASAPEAGVEEEHRPPAGWRHLELTWRNGRLTPAADESRNEVRSEAERTNVEDVEADRLKPSLQNRDDPTNSEADWTTETFSCKKAKRSDERVQSSCEESGPGDEDQCSASVHQYLDSCFPAAQPEPEPEPAVPPLSTQTDYLITWTLSQALIQRGRPSVQSAASPDKTLPKPPLTPPSVSSSTPDLFSLLIPSPVASAELFTQPCPTPRAEEGGVVLEATMDGILCSQESTSAHDSPTEPPSRPPPQPPSSKKPRTDEGSRTEAPEGTATTSGRRSPTTPLTRCNHPGVRYSVLVAVVHPCHLKEVKVKSGPSAGTFIPLASIVVTDQSGVEMKVVLWRRAAFWALTVGPGDVLLVTGLQVNEDRWRGETVLQSTFSSRLLNLGQISASTSPPGTTPWPLTNQQPAPLRCAQTSPPPVTQQVNARSLAALCVFLRMRRPLLVSLPPRPHQDLSRLPYATLRSLKVNTLLHALLRVTRTHISPVWRREAESRSRSAVQLKAVLTVEQPDSQQGALLLWGAAVEWLPRFNRDRTSVWDFRVLLVREGLTSDLPELHSTPWSSVRAVDPTDRRLQDFLRTQRQWNGGPVELDVDTLLSQKYSGEVELRVQVISFHFQDALPSQNAPQPVLDGSTPLDGVLAALSGDITYIGCARCGAELDTDANGIYGPCYACLPHTAVRCYYRPGVLTLGGRGSSQLCVQVPPVPLQKLLEAPPHRLQCRSAPGTQVQNLQVAAERIQNLLSLPRKTVTVTVQSHFLCDENSVPIDQDFTLLDLQFPS